MFKKMFIAAITFILLTPFCFANNNPTVTPPSAQATLDKQIIGIFLEAPPTYANNEEVKKDVQKKIEALVPSDTFTVLPLDTIISESKTYRENNTMPPDQAFTYQDIQKIASGVNCNYAFRITITNSSPRVEIEFPNVSSISDVTCDVFFLNVATGKYVVGLEIINKGKRSVTVNDNVSFDKQYNETLDKALKALEIDVTAL